MSTCWRTFQVSQADIMFINRSCGWIIHIPARTPLAWYHYSWEVPLWKPLNVPRTSPIDFRPHSSLSKLAVAATRQLNINCQDATLVPMTYVSIATWDDRLLEVRGWILGGWRLVWPWEHRGSETRGPLELENQLHQPQGKSPLWGEESRRPLSFSNTALHYHSQTHSLQFSWSHYVI